MSVDLARHRYAEFAGTPGGTRMVFLHGLGGCHHHWADLAPLMSFHVRGVALDLPGFGHPPAGGRSTIAACAQEVAGFVREVVGEPAVLVGNSMGALVAAAVGARAPELVSALALIDPPLPTAGMPRPHPEVVRTAVLQGVPGLGEILLRRRRAMVPAPQRVAAMLRRCCADPARISAAMLARLVACEQEATHAPPANYLRAARSIVRTVARRRAYWDLMRSLNVPVLLVHGTHDRLVPVGAARAAASRFPHWSFVEMDSGHVPHMESSRDLAWNLQGWMAARMNGRVFRP